MRSSTASTRRPRHGMRLSVAVLMAMLPLATWAHPGADGGLHHGFLHGLTHPYTGLDHLAAMLAVGFWSALCLRQVLWAPAAFALCLLLGAGLGLAGWAPPGVEPLVAASLLVLGLLTALRARWPVAAAAALAGGFAVFHGLAHGVALAGEPAAATLAGLLLGTVALHATGLALGHAVRARSPWWPRVAGGAVVLAGAGLLPAALLG